MKLPSIGWIYCFYSFAFPWRFKIGISSDYKARRKGVEMDLTRAMNMPVKVRTALAVPSLFRENHEARVHRWFCKLSASMPHHAGYMEWFWSWIPNAVGALIAAAWLWYVGYPVNPWAILVAALLPIPVVPALLLALILIVEIALVSGLLVGVFTLLSFIIQNIPK